MWIPGRGSSTLRKLERQEEGALRHDVENPAGPGCTLGNSHGQWPQLRVDPSDWKEVAQLLSLAGAPNPAAVTGTGKW